MGMRKFLKEQNEEEYYKISPEEYIFTLKSLGYKGYLMSRLPKFGKKPIWVTGDLDLSGLPVTDLGTLYVDGRVNLFRTQINTISGITAKNGSIWYGETPLRKREEREELRRKRLLAAGRRKDGEWDLDNTDEVGIKANVLYDWLVDNGELPSPDEETTDRLVDLLTELKELQDLYDSGEVNPDDMEELENRISELDNEIEDMEGDYVDVYDLVELGYGYYGLTTFEPLSLPGREYTVGTEEEMDMAVREYVEQLIDDIGIMGFRKSFVESQVDEDRVRDYLYDFYYDDISSNPEVYFDEDDFELSEEQKTRIDELQDYIIELDELKTELEENQQSLEDEIEDPDEYSEKYDEIQERIDEIEERIMETQDEIDSIEPDTEPTEEMIENKTETWVDYRMDDYMGFIEESGLDIEDFIDKEDFIDAVVRDDGYGQMNGYNGYYDSINFNGEWYYIMRVN